MIAPQRQHTPYDRHLREKWADEEDERLTLRRMGLTNREHTTRHTTPQMARCLMIELDLSESTPPTISDDEWEMICIEGTGRYSAGCGRWVK